MQIDLRPEDYEVKVAPQERTGWESPSVVLLIVLLVPVHLGLSWLLYPHVRPFVRTALRFVGLD